MLAYQFGALELILHKSGITATQESVDDKIAYQSYLSNLETMLNNGQYREVEEIYKNSRKIEVPIQRDILERLESKFTHKIEHAFLLFANSNDVINTVTSYFCG